MIFSSFGGFESSLHGWIVTGRRDGSVLLVPEDRSVAMVVGLFPLLSHIIGVEPVENVEIERMFW